MSKMCPVCNAKLTGGVPCNDCKKKMEQVSQDNDMQEKKSPVKKIIICAIVILLCFYWLKSCSDSSAEKKRIAIEQEEALRERQKQLDEQERREAELFSSSSENIRIYEKFGSKEWLQRIVYPAEWALQRYAHDPDSVQDVVPTSEIFRVRMKDYPACRFMVRVSFRAKNAFGALLKQQAIVIFDNDLQPITVLADMP